MPIPNVAELWTKAKELKLLPNSTEAREKFFDDLEASADLQKNLYIQILERELSEAKDEIAGLSDALNEV